MIEFLQTLCGIFLGFCLGYVRGIGRIGAENERIREELAEAWSVAAETELLNEFNRESPEK